MKFTEKLASHLTPEWRHQYIAYAHLKDMILKAVQELQSEPTNKRARLSVLDNFEDIFFEECENELIKVDRFFREKLAEAQRCYNDMIGRVRQYIEMHSSRFNVSRMSLPRKLPKPKTKQLKLAFSELYLNFILLQNYQTLNYTGFKKILKKHDKLLNINSGTMWFTQHVERAPFYRSKEVLYLIKESEEFFTRNLESGNRAEAMKHLRVPPLLERQLPLTTFVLGLCLGIFFTLCTVAVLVLLGNASEKNLLVLHLYRGPMLFILLLFLIGVNIMGWRAAGVNHILIFEINPRKHLRATEVMEFAALLSMLWIFSLLAFLYADHLYLPPMVCPLALIIIILAIVFNPLPVLYKSARFWFIKLMGRVLLAPFLHVDFADFFLADQLNSLVVGLIDLQFFCCVYIKDVDWYKQDTDYDCAHHEFIAQPILRCLPAWFRLAQSLRRYYDTKQVHPFLTNAGKYASSFPVIFCSTKMKQNQNFYSNNYENPYVWGYLISLTLSSIYCYAWDMLRDFGVFKKFRGKNILLREQIVYSKPYYYIAILENFVLRFVWILFFVIDAATVMNGDILVTLAAILEVLRRYIWNYFRLEHEHLYNVGEFRAVRDISVPILDEAASNKLIENQSFNLINPV